MKILRHVLLLSLITLITIGCSEVRKVTDVITNPTAREVYTRQFEKNDSLLKQWSAAFIKAQEDSLLITQPYAESGVFSEDTYNVHAYTHQLREGERLIVEVRTQPDSVRTFIDLFEQPSETTTRATKLHTLDQDSTRLQYTIKKYGYYKVLVQPEMGQQVPFQLKIYTQPSYAFPVQDATNKNVQSFWAAPRDGGRRSHEGIDIFSPRGTPVLAVTDGRISSTGNRGLGGKQVWLRDGLFGKTMYYAHLDSIAVREGERVTVGDTLGFVGNTGNAKTTAPHLHFGVYKRGAGPVDPYPYVKITEVPEISSQNEVSAGIIRNNKTPIHQGPSAALDEIGTLNKNDTISILGLHRNWYHVKVKNNQKGFVEQKRIAPINSN